MSLQVMIQATPANCIHVELFTREAFACQVPLAYLSLLTRSHNPHIHCGLISELTHQFLYLLPHPPSHKSPSSEAFMTQLASKTVESSQMSTDGR